MAFTVGENYAFEDVQKRYKSLKPSEKGLTQGGFLNPSRGSPSTLIRAIFARREINGPLDNLLFVSGDNVYRNYLNRLGKVQRESSPFLYFKEKNGSWSYIGLSKVDRLLEPGSEELTLLLDEMSYTLETVGEEDGKLLWQLSASGEPGFIKPRKLEFIALLQQDA
ncbi:hypothetical protein [Buttiauxella brennerae]|uniref:hypothetical protein n=1 Tax=Buttiauxella brennerae TaxID=82988 RepID=UPI00286F99BB|nr:hypothetical protein [Buttiauxella brennerae]